MDVLSNKISRLENYARKNNAPKAAWALALRNFAAFKLTGDKKFLERGLHLSTNYFSLNFHFIYAYYLNIYMELLQNGPTKALKMLDRLKPLRAAGKTRPLMLSTQLFLRAAIDLKRGKARSARKSVSALTALLPDAKDPALAHYIEVLIAACYIQSHEREEALKFLLSANSRERGGFLFFICLHDFFAHEKFSGERAAPLLHVYAKFALSQGLLKDLTGVLERNKASVLNLASKDKKFGYDLYDKIRPLWLLDEIVRRQIKEGDKSVKAFKYYSHAKNRQLDIPGLATAIVLTTIEHEIHENIDRYTMERYYAETGALTAPNPEDFFTFGVYAKNPAAKYLWVFRDEKDEPDIYEFTDGYAYVKAADDSFSYIVLDASRKNILGREAFIRRTQMQRGPSDAGVLLEIFRKGDNSPELLAALCKHFMSLEAFTDDGLEVFRAAAVADGLSSRFKEKIWSALGGYYANLGNFREAVKYYEGCQIDALPRPELERMLISLAGAGRLARAADILKKHTKISDAALFFAARKIAADKSLHKDMANVCKNLVLAGRYDKTLAGIALEHANAGLTEWQALSRTLAGLSAPNDVLDENILNNAIFTHDFTKGAQGAFAGLYGRSPANPYIMPFALLACYMVIVKGERPEYETLEVLEKLAAGYENADADLRLIHYALCHVYIDCGIQTITSAEVMSRAVKYLEKDGFIFPVFKDKNPASPYIEKNQPFIYHGGKGKRAKILYKSDTDAEYQEKTMRYIRFGLYAANIPIFYGEKLSYMFLEETDTGSISTKEAEIENDNMRLNDDISDLYYAINNAIIYESMFKYEAVEEIITDYLKELPRVKGWLM